VVIRFFTLKGLKARGIHTELESVYGPEALALLTVKKWRGRFHQGRTDLLDDPMSGMPLTNDIAKTIGPRTLRKAHQFMQVLCRHFRTGKVPCLRILHDKFGLNKFHFYWVPHARSINQKKEYHIRSSF
jgi:hypothetical protein